MVRWAEIPDSAGCRVSDKGRVIDAEGKDRNITTDKGKPSVTYKSKDGVTRKHMVARVMAVSFGLCSPDRQVSLIGPLCLENIKVLNKSRPKPHRRRKSAKRKKVSKVGSAITLDLQKKAVEMYKTDKNVARICRELGLKSDYQRNIIQELLVEGLWFSYTVEKWWCSGCGNNICLNYCILCQKEGPSAC